jgi:hypothetical protein
VVEHGMFLGLASACIVAGANGVRVLGSLQGLASGEAAGTALSTSARDVQHFQVEEPLPHVAN